MLHDSYHARTSDISDLLYSQMLTPSTVPTQWDIRTQHLDLYLFMLLHKAESTEGLFTELTAVWMGFVHTNHEWNVLHIKVDCRGRLWCLSATWRQCAI